MNLSELKQRIDSLPLTESGRRQFTNDMRVEILDAIDNAHKYGLTKGRVRLKLDVSETLISTWKKKRAEYEKGGEGASVYHKPKHDSKAEIMEKLKQKRMTLQLELASVEMALSQIGKL